MKSIIPSIFFALGLFFIHLTGNAQVKFSENFESGGSMPAGWTQKYIPTSSQDWRFRNGGYNPNDPNGILFGPGDTDISRNPPSAHGGTYNAFFQKESLGAEKTMLITPVINLEGTVKPELSFWLAQVEWPFGGNVYQDKLRVYYRNTSNEADPWILLEEYLDRVQEWTEFRINLPNPTSTYYIAFEGEIGSGFGVCIDDVVVAEVGEVEMWISELDFIQPNTNFVPSGSENVIIMRMDVKVFGNTGEAIFDSLAVKSLNTSDDDIEANGVKLYKTNTLTFNANTPLGSPASFVDGVVVFDNLNYSLPAGVSHFWITYDVKEDAVHGNLLDAMFEKESIRMNDTLYPKEFDVSPPNNRIVYTTIYKEDFEGVHNWTLTGEFQVDSPQGLGGSATAGYPDPANAFSGTKVLGTDLTGLGTFLGDYEPNVTLANAYKATSPPIDIFYYKDLRLSYRRHLNVEFRDSAVIEASRDGGNTWIHIWKNNNYFLDQNWTFQFHVLPESLARTNELKIRYRLGPTDELENYSGWNVDDVVITGEFIDKDIGVTEWIYPQTGCGRSSSDSITVRILNMGGAAIVDAFQVQYSLNGGATWITETVNQTIPIGESIVYTFNTRADLSAPGLRPDVRARTALAGDQYPQNDMITTQFYVVPTYIPPYSTDFEANNGFWRSFGANLWQYGQFSKTSINSQPTASGPKAWITHLTQTYGNALSSQNQTIFEDGFETDKGWQFTGEFQRAVPDQEYEIPQYALNGEYCIGTDLLGLGDSLYLYENGIIPATAYTATSPAIDVSNYDNLQVTFYRWLTIQNGDSVRVEVSPDNGATWYTLWKNTEGKIMDDWWSANPGLTYSIDDSLSYATQLKIRFSLFYSSADGQVAEGIHIDNFKLTGNMVNQVPAYLESPCFDFTDMARPVFEAKIWVDTEEDVDGVTLYYSIDDGASWVHVDNTSGFDAYWNWYTGNPVEALGVNGWSGETGEWIRVRHLLPVELTGYGNVKFRLKFQANKLNNNFDGFAIDDLKIYDAPHDLGVIAILDPVSDCELPSNQTFTLRLRNYGVRDMQTGDSIKINYHIDYFGEIQSDQETIILTESFAMATNKDFTFNTEFDFSKAGEYQVEVSTIETEPLFYEATANDLFSAIIEVKKPLFSLGPDIYTVRPDTIVLNAYAGEDNLDYLWQDNSTDSVFYVSTEGEYSVKVTNSILCFATDTIHIYRLIPDVGVTDLISPASSCELSSMETITILIENFGTDTLNIKDSIYIFTEINGSIFISDTLFVSENFYPGTSQEFTLSQAIDFSAPGSYDLKFYTELAYDTTFSNDTLETNIQVFGYSVVNLGADRDEFAASITLDAGPGFLDYLWQDGSQDQQFVVDQMGEGEYYVAVTDINNCPATDTVLITLYVMDISLDEILSPETSCVLSNELTVSLRILNSGNLTIATGEKIEVSYKVDEETPEMEEVTLMEDFAPGDTLDYVFINPAVVVTGNWYDFTIYINYTGDMKPGNDTIVMPVGVFETPVVDLGDDSVVNALEYVLDAGPGFVSYLWQDGSTNQTYTVNTPGINACSVTVTDANGCTAFDEVQILLVIPDIGIEEIIFPTNACILGTQENIEVAIKNYGNSNISTLADIKVAYSINGAAPVIENVIRTVAFGAGQTIYYTFTNTADFSVPDNYHITAYTIFTGDLVPTNDTSEVNIVIFGNPEVEIGGGQDTLIVYEQLILSPDPGFVSYLWQDGSTGNTFTIDQPGTDLYHVLVTDINGCSASDTVFVVYDVLDIGINRLITPVSACELSSEETISIEIVNNGYYRISGTETISLSYSVNEGTPVTEVKNFGNSLQPGSMMVLSFDTKHDFSQTGLYNLDVSIDFTNDQNPLNDEISQEISAWGYPVIDLGNGADTIFALAPVVLDAGSGFASYLWQDGSTGNTFTIDQPGIGLYHVLVADINGCSASDTVFVVYDVPDIGINQLLTPISACELSSEETISIEIVNNGYYRISGTQTISLSYSVNEGTPVTEVKNFGNSLQPGSMMVLSFDTKHDFSQTGLYNLDVSIVFTNDQDPLNDEISQEISAWGYPVIDLGNGADTIFASVPVVLDAGSGFASYLWQDGSNNSSYEVTQYGLYWVEVANEFGCSARDTVVVDSPVSIGKKPIQPEFIKIFPNPVQDALYIIIDAEKQFKHIKIELINLQSKVLYSNEFKLTERVEEEITMSRFGKGVYILRITTDGNSHNQSILVL